MPGDEPASILDASALIAFLHDEPGADAVVDALATTAAMSVVNWAEMLSKVAADGDDPQRVADSLQLDEAPLQLEPLTEADCVTIARLRLAHYRTAAGRDLDHQPYWDLVALLDLLSAQRRARRPSRRHHA